MSKPQTLSNIGTRLDLQVRQGSTLGPYRHILKRGSTGELLDLTGCQVRAQVRRTPASPEVAATFEIRVAADPTVGYYDFWLPADVTEAMEVGEQMGSPESVYVWDSELELPDGRVVPLYYGALRLQPEVTKP